MCVVRDNCEEMELSGNAGVVSKRRKDKTHSFNEKDVTYKALSSRDR